MRSAPALRLSRHTAVLSALLVACTTRGLHVDPPTHASAPPPGHAEAGAEVGGEGEHARADEEAPEAQPDDVLDGGESEDDEAPEAEAGPRVHPLDAYDASRLRELVRSDLASLGSMSLGAPSAGSLLNGVRAEDGPLFKIQNPAGAFGTQETVDYLCAAIRRVQSEFPETPALALGHISAKDGGPLQPHISHQSGRDVDISFYYRDGSPWYSRGTKQNLDLPRTWAFVRALVIETDVDMILIDQSIQALLEDYALSTGENAEWVRSLFHGAGGGLRRIIRHAPGHATHLHIRFFNPVAQETGRRVAPILSDLGLRKTPANFIRYRARPGDTLGKIARRFNTTVPALKSANGLRTSKIRENRDYRIPVAGKKGQPPSPPLRFPPRRLPPESATTAARMSSRDTP